MCKRFNAHMKTTLRGIDFSIVLNDDLSYQLDHCQFH